MRKKVVNDSLDVGSVSDVNIVNNNDVDMDISNDTSTNSVNIVNTSTASEKKLIDMSPSKLSTPTKKSDITGYRLVDVEILSTIVSTLSCPFCKQATIKLPKLI